MENCKNFTHIGWLVKNIESSISDFALLGYKINGPIVEDKIRLINIAFVENNEGHIIELVSPYSQKSIVYNLLQKKGCGPYHMCFCPEDNKTFLENLKKQGFVLIDLKKKAVALENKDVAFYYKDNFGILEVCFL